LLGGERELKPDRPPVLVGPIAIVPGWTGFLLEGDSDHGARSLTSDPLEREVGLEKLDLGAIGLPVSDRA
jgi:hypothetical protein